MNSKLTTFGLTSALAVALLSLTHPDPAPPLAPPAQKELVERTGAIAEWRIDEQGVVWLRVDEVGGRSTWFRTPPVQNEVTDFQMQTLQVLLHLTEPGREGILLHVVGNENTDQEKEPDEIVAHEVQSIGHLVPTHARSRSSDQGR